MLTKILYDGLVASRYSDPRSPQALRPNDVQLGAPSRQRSVPQLDDIDEAILRILAEDARLPNNAVAERVGIAPSTCLMRVRALRERGVIRGYHADIDQAAIGRSIQAMIAVRMQGHARGRLPDFMRQVAAIPGVLNVFFLAGVHDFFVHVAMATPEELRDFVVVHLSGNEDVSLTETSLIFEHLRCATAT